MPRRILLLLALLAFFFLFAVVASRSTAITGVMSLNLQQQQQSMCTSTVTISSAFGATSGSGSYPCGSIVTFGVSPTTITEGGVRHVFSGWTCSGPGCYSGSANPASVTTGGNNSITTETALWSTEYLLTISSNPSDEGTTYPSGSVWESAGSVVSVSPRPMASGWFFAYWSLDSIGNAGSSDLYPITMDSPHSIIANFVKLNVTTQLLNVTSPANGLVLRNPDGTFYRGDAFQISSKISIAGGGPLPGNLLPLVKYSFPEFSVMELSSSSNGTYNAEFQILDTAPYSNQEVTGTGYLYNQIGNVLVQSPSSSSQPFTVVRYHPIFSYFTYMEYNNLNSSTYARPFVTLVRYDGNVPGYSYQGDANTDPFSASNSTMERAFLNNFTSSVQGWSVSTNLMNPASSLSVVSYNAYDHLNVGIEMLNKSYPSVITWSHREWKFYFLANISSIQDYIANEGIIYFNVNETAWYLRDASLHYSEFNTSYLYEPLFYNGYLIFKAENNYSSDFAVYVVAHNPDPLDQYLVQKVEGIFGNDSQVLNSFEQDLYAAYSSPMVLGPCFVNSTEEVFLVNQTNIMTSQSLGEVPYFTITVRGIAGTTTYQYDAGNPPSYLGQPLVSYGHNDQNITYNVDDEYSLFAMNDFAPPAPFQEFTGYFLAQSGNYQIVMQPTSFSFSGPASYLVRTYEYPRAPYFITQEPGNLTQEYAMLYGQNVTVRPNFAAGGILGLEVSREGNGSTIFYRATIMIGGGATQLLVKSSSDQILYEQTITSNDPSIVSFDPPEYIGGYTFYFPVYANGSVSIILNGAWGALDIVDGVPVTSNYGAPAPSGITSQIMNLVWYLLVPVLFVFWFVVVWFKLKKRNSEERPASLPGSYPWE